MARTKDEFKQQIELYHELLLGLFKNLPREIGQLIWVPIQDIECAEVGNAYTDTIHDQEWFKKKGANLAKSIEIAGGIYQPLLTGNGIPQSPIMARLGVEDENGPIFCDEGRHRIDSLKRVLKWKKKVLCLHHPRGFLYDLANLGPGAIAAIRRDCEPFEIRIPRRLFINDGKVHKPTLQERQEEIMIRHLLRDDPENPDLMYVTVQNMLDWKSAQFKLTRVLTDMIVTYKKIWGEEWQAPKIVNEPNDIFPDIPYQEETRGTKLKDVRMVEIEIASRCNRKCPWCPNKDNDRFTFNKQLDEEIYLKVLDELYDEGFEGTFSFSRYNEPLLDQDLLKTRIDQIRSKFGKDVRIVFNTNGDYMTSATLRKLDVDEMTVMDYDNKGHEKCIKKIEDCNYEVLFQDGNYIYFQYYDMVQAIKRMGMYIVNWPKWANFNYRGDTVQFRIDKKERKVGCLEPKYFIGIDYNGRVVPCCEVRSDIPKHNHMVLGDLKKQSLVDIFHGPKATGLRRIMEEGDPTKFPDACKYCQKCPGRYTRDDPGISFKDGNEYTL